MANLYYLHTPVCLYHLDSRRSSPTCQLYLPFDFLLFLFSVVLMIQAPENLKSTIQFRSGSKTIRDGPCPDVNGRCKGLQHCCVLLPNMEVFLLIDSKTSRRLCKLLKCLQIIANELLAMYIRFPYNHLTTTYNTRVTVEAM